MYLVKTPRLVQWLFPNFIWSIPTEEKIIYLTFDDGPVPEATPWILDLLNKYDAKASFFCVGDNVRKYPHIFARLLEEGHVVGNHTFNHLNGWTTTQTDYLENIQHCAEVVDSKLFRPPYGRLRPKQATALRKRYNIVLWDVLSGDFDANISEEQCFDNIIQKTKKGSIIVLHDSVKTINKLQFVLPKVLDYYHQKGYSFKALPDRLSN